MHTRRGTGRIRTSNGARIAAVMVMALLLSGVAASQDFNFGISPAGADEGLQEPGESFSTSFTLVTDVEDPVDIELEHSDSRINAIGESRQENYSEQSCGDCIEYLQGSGEGAMADTGASDAEQWKDIIFLVNVPEDADPGYRRIDVTPQPSTSGDTGGVPLVSSVSFPVMFQVPGEAVRSGEILGVHAGQNVAGEQRIVTTYYNDGTVTTDVSTEITVETPDGNETVRAGTDTVPPGEESRFTARIDTAELVNGMDETELADEEFVVHASADYTTGDATYTTTVTPDEPVPVQAAAVRDEVDDLGPVSYLFLILLLLVSTLVTWKVVGRART